jgi:hypothetical protein
MPIRTELRETLTPRERQELDWEKEYAKLQVAYAKETQEAQIKHEEVLKQMELEYFKLEVRWKSLFRIPSEMVLLPVKLVMALAIPISVMTKNKLPDSFWEFMR